MDRIRTLDSTVKDQNLVLESTPGAPASASWPPPPDCPHAPSPSPITSIPPAAAPGCDFPWLPPPSDSAVGFTVARRAHSRLPPPSAAAALLPLPGWHRPATPPSLLRQPSLRPTSGPPLRLSAAPMLPCRVGSPATPSVPRFSQPCSAACFPHRRGPRLAARAASAGRLCRFPPVPAVAAADPRHGLPASRARHAPPTPIFGTPVPRGHGAARGAWPAVGRLLDLLRIAGYGQCGR